MTILSQDTSPSPLSIGSLSQYYYSVLYYWIVWIGSKYYSSLTIPGRGGFPPRFPPPKPVACCCYPPYDE